MAVTNNNFLTPTSTLSNPFPNGIQPLGATTPGLGTFLGQNIAFFNPEVRNPYSIRWNFGIERQLPGDMVLQVVYIGNHSVHLPVTTNLNGIPQQYLASGCNVAPFSPDLPLEWVEITHLATEVKRLVPVEFVYPRVHLERSPLVAESACT